MDSWFRWAAVAVAVLIAGAFAFPFAADWWLGAGWWGPSEAATVTIRGKTPGLIETEHGPYHVAEGLWLGVRDAAALSGQLQVGRTYRVSTRGRRVEGWFVRYPYVVEVLNETTPEGVP